MKKVKTVKLFAVFFLFLLSMLLNITVYGSGKVEDPKDTVAAIGGNAEFMSSAEGAYSAKWFSVSDSGKLSVITENINTESDEKNLFSFLSVKGTDKNAGTKYFCVFGTDSGSIMTKEASLYLLPSVLNNTSETDSLFPQDSMCAWLCADDLGTPSNGYLDGTGWYKIDSFGNEIPVSDEKCFAYGSYLCIPDLTSDDEGYYIRKIVNRAGSASSSKIRVRKSNDTEIKTILSKADVCGIVTPTYGEKPEMDIRSAESIKYSVTEIYWDGADQNGRIVSQTPTLNVVLKAEEGFSFKFSNGKFEARGGQYKLKAINKDSPESMSDTVVLQLTYSLAKPEDYILNDTVEITNGKGKIDSKNLTGFFSYTDGFSVESSGEITVDDPGIKSAFISADNHGKSVYTIITLKTDTVDENDPVILSDSLPDAQCGKGYLFKLEGNTEDIVWSEIGNQLGQFGLSLSADGYISGVATKKGSFTFSACASLNNKKATAQFIINVVEATNKYKVSFVKNGGKGEMEPIEVSVLSSTYTVPKCSFSAPSNKKFSHWECNGKSYDPGDKIELSGDIKLKAIWMSTVHKHSYGDYVFDENEHWKECSCSQTAYRGAHRGGKSTCTELAICSVCGAKYGELKKHNYKNGVCQTCGKADPDYEITDVTDTDVSNITSYSTETGVKISDTAGIRLDEYDGTTADLWLTFFVVFFLICFIAAIVLLIVSAKKNK